MLLFRNRAAYSFSNASATPLRRYDVSTQTEWMQTERPDGSCVDIDSCVRFEEEERVPLMYAIRVLLGRVGVYAPRKRVGAWDWR